MIIIKFKIKNMINKKKRQKKDKELNDIYIRN